MKTWKRFLAITAIGTLSVACYANANDSHTNIDYVAVSPLYRAQELSVDVFGSGSVGQQTLDHLTGNRINHNGRLGGGAGLNYFFCRYIGVGVDAYTENTAHNFIDSSSANLIARLPIGETGLAPYIYGGGGYQFDEIAQKFGQAGAGLEFRFTKNIGVFVDARYVFADKTENYGVGRTGLRFSF